MDLRSSFLRHLVSILLSLLSVCSLPVFNSRVESASGVIAQAIALYENLLEQQEKAHNETLEQREAEKMWIYQKRQELEQVQNGLEVILNKCTIV